MLNKYAANALYVTPDKSLQLLIVDKFMSLVTGKMTFEVRIMQKHRVANHYTQHRNVFTMNGIDNYVQTYGLELVQ